MNESRAIIDRRHAADLVVRREGDRFRVVKNRFGKLGALLTHAELDSLIADSRVRRFYIEEQ